MAIELTIPETISVHLGAPDSNGQNVTVSFPDYIKNVASSEIYPTWPEEAIKANILAQISFALNRIYTEHYRTKGYDFDITNSPKYDQAYVYQRNIFENISEIVDDIFNDYIVKKDEFIPIFAQYCDGKSVKCKGLSQWGSVDLAEQGLNAKEILQKYYGDDIEIVEEAPIKNISQSYPGEPLKPGSYGTNVRIMQLSLNTISNNYPGIKKIPEDTVNFYGVSTFEAVKEFQKLFDLEVDGIIGKATWYKILYVYYAVIKLKELNSEGIKYNELNDALDNYLLIGDKGVNIKVLQYFLSYISLYNNKVLPVEIDGIFGPKTRDSVVSFQEEYGLTPDGVVGEKTWNAVISAYKSIIETVPDDFFEPDIPFPGNLLVLGTENADVKLMQQDLNAISKVYKTIPAVDETGYFDDKTAKSVSAFQELFDIPVSGSIGPITWAKIVEVAKEVK